MAAKETKLMSKRRKFVKVDIPIIKSVIDLVEAEKSQLVGKTIKLDLTRQLKGKSIEAVVKIKLEDDKLVAHPYKIKLMPYFIRRMIRKRISYVEDSFQTPSQESMLIVKPFLITRKRASRAVRKTLRNKCRNWIEDYIAERTDKEVFNEVILNKMQRPLSLALKKTYPLSLCEIRVLEVKRQLAKEEIPKIEKKKITTETVEVLDQLKEIEDEKIKEAELAIKETQHKAEEIEKEEEIVEKEKKPKKARKKKEG